jgi:hypothetical protein
MNEPTKSMDVEEVASDTELALFLSTSLLRTAATLNFQMLELPIPMLVALSLIFQY